MALGFKVEGKGFTGLGFRVHLRHFFNSVALPQHFTSARLNP